MIGGMRGGKGGIGEMGRGKNGEEDVNGEGMRCRM